MKSIITAIIFAFSTLVSYNVQAEAETKKVCVMQKDPKTNKEKEVCKEIKIHKKYEGTKPEDVKKPDPKKPDTKPADPKKPEQKK